MKIVIVYFIIYNLNFQIYPNSASCRFVAEVYVHRKIELRHNVRIYVPLDISRDLILRRLDRIILQYGEANEGNEGDFSTDVNMLISLPPYATSSWLSGGFRIPAKYSSSDPDI